MRTVPFLDLKAQYSHVEKEIEISLKEVMKNTAFASGPFVQKFEKEFAEFCGAKHCIAVNSGTSALHVALLAHGVKPGDEIITVPNSFIATTWAITYCGATPVFIDADPDTLLMDCDLIEAAITDKTKVILPIHLYGQPANIDRINEIAKKHNLVVVEDAAQAHAATYDGIRVGGKGNTACFSFYPGKNLGAYGEGGAVTTDDDEVAERIQMLRNHGQSKKYHHDMIGYNYRMDGFQGAVLSIKLKYLQEWTDRRNAIADMYHEGLKDIKEIKLPVIKPNMTSAYHLFVIHTSYRDELMAYLSDNGVSAGLHYPVPIHLQPAYEDLNYKKGDFPVSESNADNCLSLPMFAELTHDDVNKVIEKICDFFKERV